jgi:hypothetical protein
MTYVDELKRSLSHEIIRDFPRISYLAFLGKGGEENMFLEGD